MNRQYLPYRFLPATSTTITHTGKECSRATTCMATFDINARTSNAYNASFSDLLKAYVFNDTMPAANVRIMHLTCDNDTGIRFCGNKFEHVERIYIHTQKHSATTEVAVILVIKEHQTKEYRFFKGIWDPTRETVTVWYELTHERAKQEIANLENID